MGGYKKDLVLQMVSITFSEEGIVELKSSPYTSKMQQIRPMEIIGD